jgi:hypothetical protein
MLYHVLDAVLGSGTKVQILRALLPLRSAVTGREAQRLAGVRSDQGARQALRELAELGVLQREHSSASHLYRVNLKHELLPALTALFEAEAGRVQTLKQMLRGALKRAEVSGRVESIMLTGGADREDAGAETGLLVVATGEKGAAKVRDALVGAGDRIFARTGVRITVEALSLERFRTRRREGDPVLEKVEAEGRVLIGAAFHELVGA